MLGLGRLGHGIAMSDAWGYVTHNLWELYDLRWIFVSVRSEGVESQGDPGIGAQLENERPEEGLVLYIL